MFDVINADTNERDAAGPYPDAAAANARASELRATTGQRHRIARVTAPTTADAAPPAWHAREAAKALASPLPAWLVALPAWQAYAARHPHHFPRLSPAPAEGPNRWPAIAFTPTPEHGETDRQTRMRSGRFLAQWVAVEQRDAWGDMVPALSPVQVQRHQELFETGPTRPLHFATAPAEMQRAIQGHAVCNEGSGSESCMRHTPGHFGLRDDEHPARAYASPDFEVAYIKRASGRFTVDARAVVSRARMHFVRVYGRTHNDQQEMIRALEAAGFERADSWDGLRLAAIRPAGQPESFLCPYVDGHATAAYFNPAAPDFITLRARQNRAEAGEVYLGSAATLSGWINEPSRTPCGMCGTRTLESALRYADTNALPPRERTIRICEACTTAHNFHTCQRDASRLFQGEPVRVHNHRGDIALWSPAAARADAFRCELSGEHYYTGAYDAVRVRTAPPPAPRVYWCRQAPGFAERTLRGPLDGVIYDHQAYRLTRGGEVEHIETAEREAAQRAEREAARRLEAARAMEAEREAAEAHALAMSQLLAPSPEQLADEADRAARLLEDPALSAEAAQPAQAVAPACAFCQRPAGDLCGPCQREVTARAEPRPHTLGPRQPGFMFAFDHEATRARRAARTTNPTQEPTR